MSTVPFSRSNLPFPLHKMPHTVEFKELDNTEKGLALSLLENLNASNHEVTKCLQCDEKTICNLWHHIEDKKNINSNDDIVRNKSHSEQPLKLSEWDVCRLIHHVMKSQVNHHKKWTVIAQECQISASQSCISNAFKWMRYECFSPKQKSLLTPEQKLACVEFAIRWIEEGLKFWKTVVWTDKTAVWVGETWGQQWVTRRADEVYYKDCIDVWYKQYTEMQFWGCYTVEFKGPYYMFKWETAEKKKKAEKDLREMNSEYKIAQKLLEKEFHAENARRPLSRRRKHISKSDMRKLEQKKERKGGIDWYQYQTQILKERLLSFCQKIIKWYGQCYLIQDEVSSHTVWQQNKILEIEGLYQMEWPANSPDLNQIEPAWFHLKVQISKLSYCVINKNVCCQAWDTVWSELAQDHIAQWIERMLERLDRVL